MTVSKFLVKESNRVLGNLYGYLSSPNREEVIAPSKLQIFVMVIVLFISLTLSLRNFNSFQLGSYQDDASYAVLAKSIVSSDAYGLINVPGQPLLTRFPFGFPLLLSPMAWLFPLEQNWMRLVSLLATLVNIFLLFWGWPYLSQNRSYWWGMAIAALYAVSPLVIGHTRMVMSEPVFTTFVLIGLILTEKYLVSSKKLLYPTLISGAVILYSVFIRTTGLALVAAVACRILLLPFDRLLKASRIIYLFIGGISLIAIIIIATPINISNLLPIEYSHQFENPKAWGQTQIEDPLIPRFFSAFLEYTRQHLREAVLPIGGGTRELEFGLQFGISNLPLFSGLIIGSLILLGTLSVFQNQGLHPTVLLFEAFYIGMVLLWSWRGVRFLYPILPFLFYHFLCGVRFITNQLWRVKQIPSNIIRLTPAISVMAVFFIMLFLSLYRGIIDNSASTQFVRDLTVGASWLRENSPRDALIMTQQPQGIYIYSDRHTIDYPSGDQLSPPDKFKSVLLNYKVDYIVVAPAMIWRQDGLLDYDKVTSEKVIPTLNTLEQQKNIKMIYQSESDLVKVYQVLHR